LTSYPLDDYLFDNRSHPLRSQVAGWLAVSPRFANFVDEYKNKIRKKIRVLNGEDMALDLLAELEAAYLLLADRRFELSYEPYAGEKRRGPDYAVTWRTNLIFNLEVTRMHNGSGEIDGRLADVVCEKLGQMLPAMINLLAIVGGDQVSAPVLASAMQHLKLLAEKRDPTLYARQGYQTPADFFKGYERMSGILWRQDEDNPVVFWNNPQARQPLSKKVRKLLVKLSTRK
jgi:hypothetical protein